MLCEGTIRTSVLLLSLRLSQSIGVETSLIRLSDFMKSPLIARLTAFDGQFNPDDRPTGVRWR
jgi:hypothetical protein